MQLHPTVKCIEHENLHFDKCPIGQKKTMYTTRIDLRKSFSKFLYTAYMNIYTTLCVIFEQKNGSQSLIGRTTAQLLE